MECSEHSGIILYPLCIIELKFNAHIELSESSSWLDKALGA